MSGWIMSAFCRTDYKPSVKDSRALLLSMCSIICRILLIKDSGTNSAVDFCLNNVLSS